MALYVKDPEVARIVEELAALRNTSKTEIIRQALRHELEREKATTFVERAVIFARRARALGDPEGGRPADKAFRDSLYEE